MRAMNSNCICNPVLTKYTAVILTITWQLQLTFLIATLLPNCNSSCYWSRWSENNIVDNWGWWKGIKVTLKVLIASCKRLQTCVEKKKLTTRCEFENYIKFIVTIWHCIVGEQTPNLMCCLGSNGKTKNLLVSFCL